MESFEGCRKGTEIACSLFEQSSENRLSWSKVIFIHWPVQVWFRGQQACLQL